MDQRLIAAAQTGDVNELPNLIAENPFLFKPAELTGGENALHIACKAGHVDFVKEVLYHDPGSAEELNADGVSPLHIASAYGYLDIVKELLKVGSHLCLVKAKNGKIPLHYAIVRGQIQVMDELLSAYLHSIGKVTGEGETCFHIALKYNKVEALGYLISHVKLLERYRIEYILNMKNRQGDSILHLAAYKNEYQVLDFLLLTLKPYLYWHELNREGLTALDILISRRAHFDETEEDLRQTTEKDLRQATANATIMPRFLNNLRSLYQSRIADANRAYSALSSDARMTMLVVIALIATVSFQAMVNPPGGVWQDTWLSNNTDPHRRIIDLPHIAGSSIFATLYPLHFSFFLLFNSIEFVVCVFLLLFLTASDDYTGGPFRFIIALMAITYLLCTLFVTADTWAILSFPVFMYGGLFLLIALYRKSKRGRKMRRNLR